MICGHCGKEHSAEGEFCPFCGMKNTDRPDLPPAEPVEEVVIQTPQELEQTEEKQNTRLLCILSLVFGFGVTGAVSLTNMVIQRFFQNVEAVRTFSAFIVEMSFLLPVAGLVLMIVARVKDPKSRFGKVVMWIYIVSAIIAVVMAIVLAIIFVYAMVSCCESFQNCPG